MFRSGGRLGVGTHHFLVLAEEDEDTGNHEDILDVGQEVQMCEEGSLRPAVQQDPAE